MCIRDRRRGVVVEVEDERIEAHNELAHGIRRRIDRLAKTHPWDWVITFHPKLTDPGIIAGYKRIAEENENVIFYEGSEDVYKRQGQHLVDAAHGRDLLHVGVHLLVARRGEHP